MSARVRRPGAIQVHGVTVHSDVVWQIGNGPVRETSAELVLLLVRNIKSDLAWLADELVTESDLGALHDALKAFNRGEGHALCLSCHRASAVLGLEVCSGCNDHAELTPDIDPDSFELGDVIDPNTDEHGRVMRPGTAPFYGGLA